jgi:hypothetical protein
MNVRPRQCPLESTASGLRSRRVLVISRRDKVRFDHASGNAVQQFLIHYHTERAHQGLDHQILEPGPEVSRKAGFLVCRERLGGLWRRGRSTD